MLPGARPAVRDQGRRVGSGRRRLIEAASASGMPPNATARLVPKWSWSTSRPAWSAAALIATTAPRASAGVSSEPSQPSAEPAHPAQSGWRRSAEPDVHRLGRQRAGRRALHGEEGPVERHLVAGQHQPQQGQRLVEYRAPLPGRHREQRPLGRQGRLETEHRQHPARCQSRERRELLGDEHGMASRQYGDPAARLEPYGLRQRVRHPGERLDRRPVHVLRQPQRVHSGRLKQAHRRLELARNPAAPSETPILTRMPATLPAASNGYRAGPYAGADRDDRDPRPAHCDGLAQRTDGHLAPLAEFDPCPSVCRLARRSDYSDYLDCPPSRTRVS